MTVPIQVKTDLEGGQCLPTEEMATIDMNDQLKMPMGVTPLIDLLRAAAASGNGIVFIRSSPNLDKGKPASEFMSYRSLLDSATRNAPLLSQRASDCGSSIVLIHQASIEDSIIMFWSVVCAGLVPAMSTPLSSDPQQRHAHLTHLKTLLEEPMCLTTDHLIHTFPELGMLCVVTKEQLAVSPDSTFTPHNECHGDLAALMLTSGSTGNAKAVELTASQIFASIHGKSLNWGSDGSSVFLNWIGLDHVANLVEIHMQAMCHSAQQVHVQAEDLLADPILFLRLIHHYRINYTFAPNFFLALLEKEIISSESETHSLELGCLRSIMSGGEANVLDLAMRLATRLQSLGTRGQVIRLGYGLTESCAAMCYGMLDPSYELDQRHEFASIGRPIQGSRMRVTNDDSTEAAICEVGMLEISGPVIFKKYYKNPIATKEAFTSDGWFKTGDRAYKDSFGKFNLVGRSKEVLNINGVKYAPQDIESALDKANLEDAQASYFAIFPYRGKDTESYCVVYSATACNINTVEQVARISSSLVTMRPAWIIPLSQERLERSSLGKLSRTKLQGMFLAGTYDDVKIASSVPLTLKQSGPRVDPQTSTQHHVVTTLADMLNIPENLISIEQTIFELGITSISLFRFEKCLRRRFNVGQDISIITFLSNPVIWAIADAIDNSNKKIYNPVAQIQSKGSKTPLWLVHPASGNTLAFLPLARTIHDRPLFALTARGLRHNEQMFASIAEMADTYLEHVKHAQPSGPYALTGYSLGTTVAFELAKRLEASGETVAFCGALDSPPHIIPLVQHLDWTAAAVLVTYFLELIPQSRVPEYIGKFRGLSKIEVVKACLEVATPAQRTALKLDPEQLLAIVNITDNFGTMAKTYHPEGEVRKIDVFYCTPLHSVEHDRESWVNGHLSRWQDFSIRQIEFHECEGDHADMLNPTYVKSFETRLAKVLQARGI